ncbi:ATP-binding cassette domain-containing protein [Sphaerisporangium sp. TRM90804]|uniref:ATP-binding cassette domain-containing protein n=1 Tax=Sphaerisporangium sp. TRM90804 TaxID=3031113 RepID=UPI00244CF685|nr:ATP-binding cassette domain-containing protein [Sphaerisporangium sp. TRM90804]MDH2427311.1 ATP-binding cassette domain-containing protein [Sphaerisporangium sp. TRM90804]
MAHVHVAGLTYVLPGGRVLLDEVSFRVGEGVTAGVVGPDGAGKSTLLRLIAGRLTPAKGEIVSSGGIGFMPRSPHPPLAGGRRRRFALEALLRGPDQVLLLDEPDDHLDMPGKEWLEDQLRASAKTVLIVSRDRQLLANAANRIISVEGRDVRVHEGGYTTFADARRDRGSRPPGGYGRPEAGPPSSRATAITCRRLRLTGLTVPFDLTVRPGERVALLGPDDAGKSSFLRTLAGAALPEGSAAPFGGTVDLGPGIRPGHLTADDDRPDLDRRRVSEIVRRDLPPDREAAAAALARYDIAGTWNRKYGALSRGERARLRIVLLEMADVDLLLLDDPTGGLDTPSADALQRGLRRFPGTVVATTHDRWLAADFTRYVHFAGDGRVSEVDIPIWEPMREVKCQDDY